MKKLLLHSDTNLKEIRVSTDFIDIYMPEASGDAVKVYLYLVRAAQDPSMVLSLQDMVDLFDVTSNRVLQSLRYWESQGLLQLSFDGDDLTDVTLLPLAEAAPVSRKEENVKAAGNPTAGNPASRTDASAASRKVTAMPVRETASAAEVKNTLPVDFSLLYQEEAFAEVCSLAEIYFGRTLSETQKHSLADCYLILDRRTDLTEYLLEYCIDRGHTSFPYIRSVAEGWQSQGFKTLEEIKAHTDNRNKAVYSVLRALGIKGRDPVNAEEDYILSWSKDFDLPLILEACKRTMSNLHTADFNYVNGILNSWKNSGVHSMQDVTELDLKHEDSKKKDRKNPAPNASGFNNASSRGTDYDALFANRYFS